MSECNTGTGDVFAGKLFRWYPDSEQRTEPLVVDSGDEIFIGRDRHACQYSTNHMFVSNRHVRIYTVIYDEDSPHSVAPLVYAQDISSNGTRWNGYPMHGKSFLLSDGDILTLVPEFQLLFESAANPDKDFTKLQKNEMQMFKSSYCVTRRELGSGAYGRVQMAYQVATGQQIACKVVDIKLAKAKYETELQKELGQAKFGPFVQRMVLSRRQSIEDKLSKYYREAHLLKLLSHPNIISFETAIHSRDSIYIFSELVTAGDLVSFLRYRGGNLKEPEAAFITRQVLLAIEYLHDRDIVHRDIKPDNILLTSLESCGRVVLTDFGCARLFPNTIDRMKTITGTYEYCAPEVNSANKAGYGKPIDLYSLGCVTVTLLMGFLPARESHKRIDRSGDDLKGMTMELIQHGVTGYPQNFIKGLLVLDEKARLNVKQALLHQWFEFLPEKDELEDRYQKAVDQWIPRPRSDPAIVTFDDIDVFQASAGQTYTLYTKPGHRLQNYKLFDSNTEIPHSSLTGTLFPATESMPLNKNDMPSHHQQESVPPGHRSRDPGPRTWSPPSASSSLFSSRRGDNKQPEVIHRTERIPAYLAIDENQIIPRATSHPRDITELNKAKCQFVNQIGRMGSGMTSIDSAPLPEIYVQDEDLCLAERLTRKPRCPSNDSLFYIEGEDEPMYYSAPPETAKPMRRPPTPSPVGRPLFVAPTRPTNVSQYTPSDTSSDVMGAGSSYSEPVGASVSNNTSFPYQGRGASTGYRPAPARVNIPHQLHPNRPFTRQRAAEARNAQSKDTQDGCADNRDLEEHSKRKRRIYGVPEDEL